MTISHFIPLECLKMKCLVSVCAFASSAPCIVDFVSKHSQRIIVYYEDLIGR